MHRGSPGSMTMPMVTTSWRSSMRRRLRARVRSGTRLQCLGCRRNLSRAWLRSFRAAGWLAPRRLLRNSLRSVPLPHDPLGPSPQHAACERPRTYRVRTASASDPGSGEAACGDLRDPALSDQAGDGVDVAAAVVIGIWDRALKNSRPNISFDYGGRLMAAWLDR